MMKGFSFQQTALAGLLAVTPFVAADERGAFIKDYSREVFRARGLDYELAEVFYTKSHTGVIRAIHFQREKEQPKLVRCVAGCVFDVVVDLRAASPTFGKWQAFTLSAANNAALLVPGSCGHGYLVLEPSIVSYKCAEQFYGEYDDGIIWNDAELAIAWPLDRVRKTILSKKDEHLQTFKEFREKYASL